MQLPLTEDVIRGMTPGRVYKDFHDRVNSISYHRTEDLLAAASDDDTIQVFDTAQGNVKCTTPSKKYGCACVTWTHSAFTLLLASNKGGDHAVRYLNLTQQAFMQYYRGHTGKVTGVAMSPKNDMFMTASQDGHVRLWDLRTPHCQAIIQVGSQPCVAFDQQGLVFAVGGDNGIIKLYDVAGYTQGPFDAFVVKECRNSPLPFSHLSFSNDGKYLLGVVESKIFVLDAYEGSLVRKLSNMTPEAGTPPEASISYDSQYVLSGCEDRSLRVWSIQTGAQVAAWTGHASVPHCAKWAPRRISAASACGAVMLWIPNRDVLEQAAQNLARQQQQQQQQQAAVVGAAAAVVQQQQQYYVPSTTGYAA